MEGGAATGIRLFASLANDLLERMPDIEWSFVMGNVASMPKKDRDAITRTLDIKDESQFLEGMTPFALDAAILGLVRRPRLYWTSFKPQSPDMIFEWDKRASVHRARLLAPVERGLLALESKDVLEVVAFDSDRDMGRYSVLSNS